MSFTSASILFPPLASASPKISLPNLDLPDISLPDVRLPDISLPDTSLPDFDLPDMNLPDFDLPDISLPDINLSDSLGSLASLADQIQSALNMAVTHPIWTVAAVVLIITLVQILADLLKRSVKAVLAFLITLPLTLSQWIWRKATTPSPPSKDQQIQQLIEQLEKLRDEQDSVIAQLKSLLQSSKPQPAPTAQLLEMHDIETHASESTQLVETEVSSGSSTVSPDVG